MDLIKKIKSVFKKEKGYKAMHREGRRLNYGSGAKFPGGMSRSAPINIHDHFALRQYARDAVYDCNVAKSMIDRFADTVVDTGLKLKPTPAAEILGITPEEGELWAEDVAARFHIWAKSKKSHRSEINNLYQNQRLYEIFQQRENDIFVRFYYTKDKSAPNPLQISFLDPNQIRGYSYTSSYTQDQSNDDGIIRNDAGKEIAYKIWEYDRTSRAYKDKIIPAMGEKSKRRFMLHGFNPEYAGQGRGYSRIAHVLQEFEQITGFSQSVIEKAINQSSYVFAVENDQQDPGNFLEGRVAGPIREYGSFPQPASDAQNITDNSIEPIINYTNIPEATNRVPGSTGILNMRKGDKLKYLQDTSPSQSYDAFLNSFVSYLSASNGMPIEVLLMKFNQNYSASRGALILFWRVAQIWRDEMAADFLDPTYEAWLSEEIASGRIKASGWSDPIMRQAWLMCEWAGSPMPNIDPLKTAAADEKYAALSAQTLDDIARNLNGSSGKANRLKNKRQFAELPIPPFPIQPHVIENIKETGDDDGKPEDS